MAHNQHSAGPRAGSTSSAPSSNVDGRSRRRSSLHSSARSSLDSIDELHPLSLSPSRFDDPQQGLLGTQKVAGKRSRVGLGRIFRRSCCLIVLGLVASIIFLLGAGGYWAVTVAGVPPDGQSEAWYPTPRGGTASEWTEAYKKASALVSKMTLVEKVNITTGTGWMMGPCVGNTGAVHRLDFPALCLQDGPLGLRFTDHTTAFPAGITVGAGWNKTAMYYRGKAHALEARGKGVNIILGPSMGPLGRLPAGGRNWEGFGPDPVLSGLAAFHTIKGIQDQGVIATAKHYIANEQEHFRQSWEWATPNAISSNLDDRTLHELYAWPFGDAVRAGVASVMCSYNQINNSYACQNSKLLNGVLKDELGFQGFVQSDWLAQRSGVASALAGLDMSMPGDGLIWQNGVSLWGSELTKAVLNETVPLERLDDMVLRIVAAWYQLGQDNTDLWPRDGDILSPNFSSWTNDRTGLIHPGSDDGATGVVNEFVDVTADHYVLARQIAEEGIVLVKNEQSLLPLSRNGHGLLQSTKHKLKVGVFGEDAFDNPKGPNACADRACNDFTLGSGWGSGAVEFPYLISPMTALRNNFVNDSVDLLEWPSNDLSRETDRLAGSSDLCLVFITSDAGEGFASWKDVKGDRVDLYSQKDGDALVKRVADKCGNGSGKVVVVLHAVGPTILEEWIDHPNILAVLLAHLPGQESGNALASILFGDVNPSGHLPYTVARSEEDYGPSSKILRSTKSLVPQQDFTERLYIDYRHFDAHDIEPRFEFGFGLSYTTFNLTDLAAESRVSERRPFPKPRPSPQEPPKTDRRVPSTAEALFPESFRPIKKFIYPYINSLSDAEPSPKPYPYPPEYKETRRPSQAGGGQGGNPDLYEPVALVKATLHNTGLLTGAAVVQIYVSFPEDVTSTNGEPVDFPPRQLRAFEKVVLRPGTGFQVELELTRRDLSYWDVAAQNWVLPEQGDFKVAVGLSSRDFEEVVLSF